MHPTLSPQHLLLPLLPLLLLLILQAPPTHPQHLENDLQSLLHDIDGGGGGGGDNEGGGGGGDDDFEVELFYRPESDDSPLPSSSSSSSSSSSIGVRRLWGVEDTKAFIGCVFSHAVPKDAFQGHVKSYQVRGLPGWLSWDDVRGVVEGVARPSDRGHHYVTIRARGADGSVAKDVFAIDVVDLPGSFLSHDGRCRGRTDITVLSVLLDAHLSSLTPLRRLALLRAANTFQGLNASFIPASHDSDPLANDAALQAGPGSAKLAPPSPSGRGVGAPRTLSQLQWVVGCDGEVRPPAQQAVDRTEGAARSGELEKVLGVPVLGWDITQVNPKSKRVRRQADYSGDYGYDEDYEDYEEYPYNGNYDYDNYVYEDREEPETGDTLNFDYAEPETRVIPGLATPTFPEASATLLYPSPSASPPGSRPRPDSSLHFSPVYISTPVFVPDKPTRILEASPTVTYETALPTILPPPYPTLDASMPTQPTSAPTTTATPPITPTTTSTRLPITPSIVPTHTTTETAVKNYKPMLRNRIQKLAWIAGHVYRQAIPADTFLDLEDGNTRNLELTLKTVQGLPIGVSSWIQLNPHTQELYALPLEKHIGWYSFILEAKDSEGKTEMDTIKIHVQQPREGRNYNHRFTAVFVPEKRFDFASTYDLDWQVKVVEKVAALYGDADTDSINVRSISIKPHKVTWTNTTLANPRSTTCPADQLEAVAEVVVSGGHGMTREVQDAFMPEFLLKRVHLHYMGHCEVLRPSKPDSPGPPVPPPEAGVDKTDAFGDLYNREPIIRNPIDLLNATAGLLLRFQVPEDTCYDLEDGDSHKLKMRLLTSNLAPIPSESWLQFDSANHEFFGIPLDENVGKTEYNLECVDKGGKKVIDALFVSVTHKSSKGNPAAQFSMTIHHNYREFIRDAHLKARLVERIATVFGDEDTRHIAIDAMTQGSVVITWHNATLPTQPCPAEEVARLRKIMLDEDGQILPTFIEAFAPEYRVMSGKLIPGGVCLGGDTPTHQEKEEHQPPVQDGIEGDNNDYLINFIIPAVIIAAMLLLAAVIACCLYRRRRYGKMTMADDTTFVSKGIPIIFAEELDDKPDPAKSPVIMKEEKPPLPPPEYQRAPSPAASATPPSTTDHRRRHQSGEGGGGDDAPSYQPPPPFTSTNGASRHPRPNMPPTYRKPPTYVPP